MDVNDFYKKVKSCKKTGLIQTGHFDESKVFIIGG